MCFLQWLIILTFPFMKVLSAPAGDFVNSLPGQPAVTFKQYAGYVTVNEKNDRALFYYFVEAETDPHSKPLVLWLNGGPGCSSFGVGGLSENGPFYPEAGKLIQNCCSWNKEANMLYLESPAGVGFSYSKDLSYYMGANDTTTATDNVLFLHGWFKKFPEYKTRELYLTGESYAGHYIPQLAELIVEQNRKEKIFNLKGIAIGNPLLDFVTDLNARQEFLWSHGLVSDPTYNMMKTHRKYSSPMRKAIRGTVSSVSDQIHWLVKVQISKYINTRCNYSSFVREAIRGTVSSIWDKIYSIVSMEIRKYINQYDVTIESCLSPLLMQRSKMMFGMTGTTTVKPDVCVQDEVTSYLNTPAVQKAFHARLVGSVKGWEACSSVLEYDDRNWENPTIPLLGKLVMAGIRVLVYSGDQDSIIPLTGTRTLVNNLATSLKLNTTVPYSVWFQERQVAGQVQVYGNILAFATVKGGGHEVPFSQPERSLILFKSFLKGQTPPSSRV